MALLEYDQFGNQLTQSPRLPSLSRIAGLILVVIGTIYICLILTSGIRIIWDTSRLNPTLAAMSRALDLQDVAVTVSGTKISLGRSVAFIAIILWYVITSSIALKLIGAGRQLMMRDGADQRAMLAMFRDFVNAVRQRTP